MKNSISRIEPKGGNDSNLENNGRDQNQFNFQVSPVLENEARIGEGSLPGSFRRQRRKVTTNINTIRERSESSEEVSTSNSPNKPSKVNQKPRRSWKLSKTCLRVNSGQAALMSAFGLSIYVILSISLVSSNNKNWPWGLWYFCSLIFDQFLFSPLLSMIQFIPLYRFFFKPKCWISKKVTPCLIGKDIMIVFQSKFPK